MPRLSKPSKLKRPVSKAAVARKRYARRVAVVPPKPMEIRGFDTPDLPRDPYVRRLTLPKLPNGMQLGSGMAFDDAGGGGYPNGAYLNQGGLGAFNLYFPGYPYLAMLTQRSEFKQPVETVAKEMTRKWIEFKSNGGGDKKDKIKKIKDAFRHFKIREIFRKGEVHDGQYGVGHICVNIRGHEGSMGLPLEIDEKSITQGSLKGFKNIDPTWCTPVMWNANDATADDYYVPETWNALAKEVHKSRIKQIISYEVPDLIKPAYNFGGISLQQLIEPYVDRWLKTVSGVNRMINNYSLIALKTDMSAVLAGGSDSNIRKRMKLARQYGDNSGMFMLDMAKEELMQIAVPLSGLSELQAQAQEHMAAPTHLPLPVLTGITPSGLNATAEGDIEIFQDWVHSQQEDVFRDVLEWVFRIIQLHLFGVIDEDILFDFVPLKQVTGEALARIKKTQSEMDVAYIDSGVVDREEVRERVAIDPDSGYSNLDTNKVPEFQDAPDTDDEPEDPDEDEANAATDQWGFDAEWEESKHPRDATGQFGSGGGGENSKLAKPKLTSTEKTWLDNYSGDTFLKLNSELRSGKTPEGSMVKHLDSAIGKGTLTAGTTLYRGMNTEAAKKLFDGNITVGQTISDPAYASTSKSRGAAMSWGTGGVLLKVSVMQDAQGLDTDGIARAEIEQETLLPRNAKMRVTRISKAKEPGSPVVVEVAYGDDESQERKAA